MPPVMITNVTPKASRALMVTWVTMIRRLGKVKNLGVMIVSVAHNKIRASNRPYLPMLKFTPG
jgi:hypothetical protein